MIEDALALALLLVATVSLGRLVYGPGSVDRMLVAQLMGSAGVAVALTLNSGSPSGALVVALVLALLAAVSGAAFARRFHPPERDGGDG
ncbi:hypothetical protein [Thiohalorhabdus methylotrophus]|uniref:Multisubunit sodium/proton antiporter MrpF subunit n=1 Tax=Thiohalorhabdus methylotrophus TaxID=3242694 RepID=A0ABV4TRG0_9GAMM